VAREDIIMASQEELKRLHVIRKVQEKMIKQVEAGELLGLSSRQVRRIVKRVKAEGARGVIHRSRGRSSNRAFADWVKGRVLELYREKYEGFGPTLAAEKLLERDGMELSEETLRGWLMESGDWKKSRKRRGHRQWRERKGHCGEMVQMDGSHHDWLEGRGSECVLMGYIDDATGRGFGRFYGYEGTVPAMDSFRRYIERYGVPLKVYLDKHTTYKSNGKPTLEEELAGIEPLSEFERALKELGVEVIHAHSPQAKGRIERFFGTLQDRLVKEMRLRGVKTIEEANLFLEEYWPLYNRQFAVGEREKGDLHRELPKRLNLDHILCRKVPRALRNDFTLAYNRKLYQIDDSVRVSKVLVHERVDGSLAIVSKDRFLKFREIVTRPEREKREPSRLSPKKTYIPPKDHSWRKFKFGKGRYDSGISPGVKP
jgi:transposase InsO family protein